MRRAHTSIDNLPQWVESYGVELNKVSISKLGHSCGCGIFADTVIQQPARPFIVVPPELVINVDRVWDCSRKDLHLREILEANGEFAKTPRGAILIFLLMQIAHSSPDMSTEIGISTAFSEYVKFIADERSLPTFWTEQQRNCLWATSLEQHVTAKMRSLEREYETFCEASRNVAWKDEWWGDSGCLSLDDWKVVDAMYRSRAMDFDQYGLCLIPIMDMANHADEFTANAMYSIEGSNNEARLYLDGKESVQQGDEIIIIYGLQKGASEMLFSYGFIEKEIKDAGAMMLGWEPPDDDELRYAKMEALDLEPGFMIYVPRRALDVVRWAGPCVWAMAVNQEDGLRIQLIQDSHGEDTLNVWFKDKQITIKDQLQDCLMKDRFRDIFQLRAYSYVVARLEEEIHERKELQGRVPSDQVPEGIDANSSAHWAISERLRDLEMSLLIRARDRFERTVEFLMGRKDVEDYLAGRPLEPRTAASLWEEFPEIQEQEQHRESEEARLAELLPSIRSSPHEDCTWPIDSEASEEELAQLNEEYLQAQRDFAKMLDAELKAREDTILEESSELRSEAVS